MGTRARRTGTGWTTILALAAALAALGCGSVTKVDPDGAPGDDGADDDDGDDDVSGDLDAALRDGAPEPDARPLPTAPPVTIGQSAVLVLGAPSFTDASGGLAANRFRWASGITADDDNLWIADIDNARVLRWSAPPAANQQAADLVVGQADFDSRVAGPTNARLTPIDMALVDGLADVTLAGDRLVVVDGQANRVLVWNQQPDSNGAPADMVLGQTTFNASTPGVNADQLNGPSGAWSDGEVLIVIDQVNNRALVWTSFPTANGQPADLVLGQSSFTSNAAPSPPTASSMNLPTDVIYDGERLYIVDSENNRIMGWNGIPTESNQPADFFVGQPDGVSNIPNAGAGSQNASAAGMHIPGAMTVAFGSLFVCDRVNFRVLVYSPRPSTTGEDADAVLGFATFDSSVEVGKGQNFTPRGLGVFGDRLYLADSNVAFGSSRVLIYQLANLP